MPTYRITAPDGKAYRVEAPEGTTREQALARLRSQLDAAKAPPAAPAPVETYGGPTANSRPGVIGSLMDTSENAAAGIGSGLVSVLRAVGGGRLARAMGMADTKEEAEQLDAPLLDTTAGSVGRVAGLAAPAALAIPFTPATLPGALAAGVGTGALMTEGDAGDRMAGAAMGGLGAGVGAAIMPAARVVRGVWRGLTEPLTAAGRDRIAGRALQQFTTRPDALQRLAAGQGPTITGARPTLAEATRDPGIATLQRAVAGMDPEASAALMTRQMENNAARLDTLRALAGEAGAELPAASRVRRLRELQQGPSRASATGTRSAQAREAYGDAFARGIDQDAAELVRPQLVELLARPSVQRAMTEARNLAREEGLAITDDGSVAGLHYAKQALDDMIETATRAGDANRARLIGQTAADLGLVLDEIAPAYQTARAAYRQLSVPVNRQQVAERLLESATPERDLLGNRTLRAGPFARQLNDEERLLEQATGFGGAGRTLNDILTPTQSQRIGAVRDELELLTNLGKDYGGNSQTAKMLASQNLVRQVAGPLGLPDSWLESTVGEQLVRPLAWVAQPAERRVAGRIAQAALDPEAALTMVRGAEAFDAPRAMSPMERQLRLLLRRATPASAGALGAYGAGQ